MVNISKQQHIFLFFVALLPINIFASEARNTPPTLVQRAASPEPMEPPSPTLTVAYPEEMVEEKLEGERTEKKRKFEQEEADEQETTSRSKRQKIEVERPQQQPAAAPVAPAAADAAQAENLFTFGNYYYQGNQGFPQDKNLAINLWQQAVRLGHKQAAEALENLKKQAAAPIAAPAQEPTLAELEKAALAGNPRAQTDLGIRYAKGSGVAKDLKKAAELFEKAVKQDFAPAQVRLKRLQGQEPTILELEKAIEKGDVVSQTQLGWHYYTGTGIAKDLKKAFDLYTRAANQGFAPAQNNLGYLYQHGFGVAKDLKKAFDLYTRAANQGNALAQAALRTLQAQVPAASSSSSSSASSAAFGSAIQEQAPAVEQQAPSKLNAKKSVAGQIAQAVLDAQKTKAATMRILQIAPKTLENLLEGQEGFGTQAKVTMLFKKARTAGTLATEWKLSEETIKQLEALVDKE